MEDTVALALAAWAVEIACGWPAALYRRVRHPVVWIGAMVRALERRWNLASLSGATRRSLGVSCTVLTVGVAAGSAALVVLALPRTPAGLVVTALLASSLLASRSLDEHVRAVGEPLAVGDVEAARVAVACVVGRDPATLDEAGIARAAIESLAENASDGVVAPLFWCALLGLPGLAAYKAINTLDSMIGHRTARHADFGRFAARLDDVVNLVPARLCAGLMALAGAGRLPIGALVREARAHRSPNAGWPESVAARVLGVRLSGPRRYADGMADEPWLNPDAPDPDGRDVLRALTLYRGALAIGAGGLGTAWLVLAG